MIGVAQIVGWIGNEVLDAAWSEAMRRIMKCRAETSRNMLLEELERGTALMMDIEDEDEAAAMVFEYANAAEHGAARRNLRMLAQILVGALVTPPIYASEFLRWSRIIADLTREEIIVLAHFYRANKEPGFMDTKLPDYRGLQKRVLLELQRLGVMDKIIDLTSTLGALERTGLVVYSVAGFGGAYHRITPKLEKLMALIRIEDVLAEPNR
ncbi:MAG: hypothetical protein P4L57_06445 [Rhizomicrobium sp.]|nr:hypothetical protein [Rhizomicrobium sp.]